jgi:tetratricopeptide (TPR) repeat protein
LKILPDKKKQILEDKNQLSINQISKKYGLPRIEIKKIIEASERKTPKWFYVIMVLLPVVFLVILEFFLRTINYGYDFTQWVDAGEGKYILNPNIGKKYFPESGFDPLTDEDVFDKQKNANSFRVFVLGGSSAEGFPYRPMGSFSRYIRRRLELVYPNTEVEVVNISMTAVNSYTLLDLMPGVLDQKPDLILIYAGHNEYYGALGVGSVESLGSSRTLINLILYLDKFRITQLVRNSIHWITSLISPGNKKLSGTLMSKMAQDKYILLNSKVFNEGIQQFKENLTDILEMIKDNHVPVILGSVASNLKDQKPFISVKTPGYKTADQVYNEAEVELKNNNTNVADSLFRLAKDLDALRFRAPEKINNVIDDLGRKFHVLTVPIDSLFDSESPGGVVGDNLIVDQLHPNIKGQELIGKAFYDCMEKYGYVPKTEKPAIPFNSQDSLARADFMFSRLDSVIGNDNIIMLKSDWPFVRKGASISELSARDFMSLLKPKDFIDSIAAENIEGKISWLDAHLMAATTYLRRDDIKDYLRHMNILIYQYPNLKDIKTAVRFFYQNHKISMTDYTTKRVGLIALYTHDFDGAIKLLNESYKSNPKDPLVLYSLALSYSKKENLKEALTMINKCLSVKPDYQGANNLKQQILSRMKK